MAKWLIPKPRIIILDQPTRGIDVGAKAEIHRIISHLATAGHRRHPDRRRRRGSDGHGRSDPRVSATGRVAAEMQRGSFDREAILLAAAHAAQDHDGARAA